MEFVAVSWLREGHFFWDHCVSAILLFKYPQREGGVSHAPQRKAPAGPAVLDVASGCWMDGAGFCMGLLFFVYGPPSTVPYPRSPLAPRPAPTRSPAGPSGAEAPPAPRVHIPLSGVTTSRPRWVLSPPFTSGSLCFCPLIVTDDLSEKQPSVATALFFSLFQKLIRSLPPSHYLSVFFFLSHSPSHFSTMAQTNSSWQQLCIMELCIIYEIIGLIVSERHWQAKRPQWLAWINWKPSGLCELSQSHWWNDW